MMEETALSIQDQGTEIMPASMGDVGNLFLNTKQLATIGKFAAMYAKSSMVPLTYQGSVENCFVALELATRMNVSPILVMQNLYIVQGKPSWSGQACVALISGSGLFGPLSFVFVGDPASMSYGCYAEATRLSNARVIRGTTITMQMAQDEGWLNKSGSKWKTMPEQMLKYRAAAFFARTECPHVLMGYQTVEETQDVYGMEPENRKTTIRLEDQA